MNEQRTGLGEGILRGLKRIIFTETQPSAENIPGPKGDTGESGNAVNPGYNAQTSDVTNFPDEKKQRVYQLLEKINKPGCDFFEVWNAAVEMGGVNTQHIRSAYTSLRFADSSLNKTKLIDTGNAYMNELKKILHEETEKRRDEKKRMEADMEKNSRKLDDEIRILEEQIQHMQQKLSEKKSESENIQSRYSPQVQEIEAKINEGRMSVDLVLGEMQEVMNIIQKEIN